MNHPNAKLTLFSGPEELARAATQQLLKAVTTPTPRPLTVALPGGRIYVLFFKYLAEEAQKSPGALSQIHFFWGDERCVPPDHAESNYRLAYDELLKPLQILPDHIHRIQGEEKPSLAAEAAGRELRALAPAANDVSILDYVFLGMGEDGHVASLFPGETPEQMASKDTYRAVVGPKPPPDRVTLGYDTLWAAKEVWVLISGPGKSGALRQSLGGRSTPLGRVLSRRSHTVILTDCDL